MEVKKISLNDGNVTKINFGSILNDESNTLSGSIELDIENQNIFIDHINAIFDEGVHYIIINMENIIYIDSSGLWALFECHKKATQKNGKISLLSPQKDVKRVLDITKISNKINISEKESDALDYFLNS